MNPTTMYAFAHPVPVHYVYTVTDTTARQFSSGKKTLTLAGKWESYGDDQFLTVGQAVEALDKASDALLKFHASIYETTPSRRNGKVPLSKKIKVRIEAVELRYPITARSMRYAYRRFFAAFNDSSGSNGWDALDSIAKVAAKAKEKGSFGILFNSYLHSHLRDARRQWQRQAMRQALPTDDLSFDSGTAEGRLIQYEALVERVYDYCAERLVQLTSNDLRGAIGDAADAWDLAGISEQGELVKQLRGVKRDARQLRSDLVRYNFASATLDAAAPMEIVYEVKQPEAA